MTFRIAVCSLLVASMAQPVHGQDPKQKRLRPALASQGALPGIVQPKQSVELVAQSDGILAAVNVREGQQVRRGQNLLQFNDAMARASVKAAESAAGDADIKVAEVDLRLAQAELRRMLSIPDPRALAAVELDRAKAAVERAKAGVEQATQSHKRALSALVVERERLNQLHVDAPFDGVVVRISTQQGASLVRAMPMITVANLSTLKVELFAELKHFSRVTPGQSYLLHASAPVDRPLVGKLISREPLIDAATKTFRCVFEIPNTDHQLPAGFTVHFRGEQAPTSLARSGRSKSLPRVRQK